jgi:3-phenylpropionate/trans-cinnamate dioxygenase ferredoxin component
MPLRIFESDDKEKNTDISKNKQSILLCKVRKYIPLFVKVCNNISELEESDLSRLEVNGKSVMIARVGERIYATDVWCTHEQADLSLGIFRDCVVKCPLHGAEFDVATGCVVRGPNGEDPSAISCLKTYASEVRANELWIDL